jgi:hypothetical protein
MSTQNNLSSEGLKLQKRINKAKAEGKVLDVTYLTTAGEGAKSITPPEYQINKFGTFRTEALSIAYNIEPLPLISANLEGYENALNLLNLENSESYIRAWEDQWIVKNIDLLDQRYHNYVDDLKREFELVDKYYTANQNLSTQEFDELQRLKNSRLLFLVDDDLFNIQNFPIKFLNDDNDKKELRNMLA